MIHWKLERKRILLFLLSVSLCGSVPLAARSRWGKDAAAFYQRTLPLTYSDQSLLAAVKADDLNGVRLAIQAGANIDCQDRVRFLVPVGEGPMTHYTPLILSTMNSMQARFSRGIRPKHLDILNYLLEHGADPDLVGSGGTTALHLVSANGDLDAARLLLDAGADPDGRSSYDDSPLGRACYSGRFEVAKLLRDKGASVNHSGEQGASPLHQTVGASDFPQISRWLISEGANVNARDSLGQTPLHRAVMYGRVETVRLLMRAGASSSMRNLRGQTPTDVARRFAASVIEREYGASKAIVLRAQQTQRAMLASMLKKRQQSIVSAPYSKAPNY